MIVFLFILVTESVQLTRAVLLINAECYTAWNARYYCYVIIHEELPKILGASASL